MTHARQGKDHQPEHSMACTAAPGPCICQGPKVGEPYAARLDISKLTVDRLYPGTMNPASPEKILVQEPIVKNYLTVRNKQGVDVALFDGDYNLTGGKLRHTIDFYKSIAVSARNESSIYTDSLAKLRDIQRKNDRSATRTIAALTILSVAGWGLSLARGIWGF